MNEDRLIWINPSLETLRYGRTLGYFCGRSRCNDARQSESIDLYDRLQKIFIFPRRAPEVEHLDIGVYQMLPKLLSTEILVTETAPHQVGFHGEGRIAGKLQRLINMTREPLRLKAPLLVCIPDTGGLSLQQEALASLKPGWTLLTGFYRGTTVYILPILVDRKTDVQGICFRLLSTEAGIANLYLADELSGRAVSAPIRRGLADSVANWVASDLLAMMRNGVLVEKVARIYRGSFVLREDVSLVDHKLYVCESDTMEEKSRVISQTVCRLWKSDLLRFNENFIGGVYSPLFTVHADIARARMSYMTERESHNAWGTGYTRASARVAAFMEAIERYSTESYVIDNYKLSSRSQLSLPTLDYHAITGCGEFDECCDDLPPDIPRRWHSVHDLSNGAEYLVPLELVRFPVVAEEVGYTPPDQFTSSGVAAHFSRNAALANACHELVERDAFLIAWLRKAAPPLIHPRSLSLPLRNHIALLDSFGYRVRIMNLTTDLAPVICVLISNKKLAYHHSLGASSHDNAEKACWKAIQEASLILSLPIVIRVPPRRYWMI